MKVAVNSIKENISHLGSDVVSAVVRVVERGWFVLGPEVKAFEASFSAYCGVSHCISVANGTDALELAVRAVGATNGELVATVANAGMYSGLAMMAAGAQPIFMDVDESTQVTTLAEVKRVVAAGAKAVIVTHLYGRALPEIVEIAEFCKSAGVPLIEDCAQAHGAEVAGLRVGAFGDLATFSFYPTKNLGALGDGGAVVSSDPELANAVRTLRQYGWAGKYSIEHAGGKNSRLDEMQAAILSVFLPHLDEANARRRAIAQRYSREIVNPAVAVPGSLDKNYVGHLYVVRSAKRDALRQHLAAADISAEVHYPIPDHKQPAYAARYADVSLPVTERLAAEVLTLPCYPAMSDEQVTAVIAAVNSWQA